MLGRTSASSDARPVAGLRIAQSPVPQELTARPAGTTDAAPGEGLRAAVAAACVAASWGEKSTTRPLTTRYWVTTIRA